MRQLPANSLAAALGAVLAFVPPQNSHPPSTREQSPQQQSKLPQSQSQIRVVTEEVTVAVTAMDAAANFTLDLEQKNFHVFDDGVEQKIDHWDLGGTPLAVALVIETSSRLRAAEPAIHDMASIFTESVMALDGEAAVITYDSTVDVRQPFTTDHESVANAISETQFIAAERSLYDALEQAVDMLAAQPEDHRRILLLLGESQDDESKAKLGTIVRKASRANITIYVIGPSSVAADLRLPQEAPAPLKLGNAPPVYTNPPKNDQMDRPFFDEMTPAIWLLERGTNQVKHHQLAVAAAATGGVSYSAFRDTTIRSALHKIGDELYAQYLLTYRPSTSRAAGFHKIDVTVTKPGITVRARPGYYVAPLADSMIATPAAPAQTATPPKN
ncbi:MAG: VWA domain-containing protein [Candidatus Acidiferrales bacterium]